jgi:protoporphyrin/coproporphyrin ferrochelatase
VPVAILLMAYGTPDTLEAVEPYYTHIRGGRVPSPEGVANLRARYERVGGTTPLLDLTRAVQERLAARFAADGDPRPVYVGMKHWHPYIAETVATMAADGVRRATAIVLAPHYSRISIGGYRKYLEQANAELATPVDVRVIERWGAEPEFIAMMATLVRDGLEPFHGEDVTVVFTAHSLPVRIREWKDPYEAELLESSRLAAEAAGVTGWRFAWQSAGATGEPWIGPDILEYLGTLAAEGVRNVLQVPIGFVADHLEVLYDIDVEARDRAAALGMKLRRTRLPNADPDFIDVLAAVIRRAESVPAEVA